MNDYTTQCVRTHSHWMRPRATHLLGRLVASTLYAHPGLDEPALWICGSVSAEMSRTHVPLPAEDYKDLTVFLVSSGSRDLCTSSVRTLKLEAVSLLEMRVR
jgi:hypothetical protein